MNEESSLLQGFRCSGWCCYMQLFFLISPRKRLQKSQKAWLDTYANLHAAGSGGLGQDQYLEPNVKEMEVPNLADGDPQK